MNVNSSGPAGYDYQYLSSLYVILFFSTDKKIEEIYIDREDGHDLTLWICNQKRHRIEFEFKDKVQALNKSFFIDCITKFTPKRNDEYVLSSLTQEVIQDFYLFTSARSESFSDEYSLAAKNTNFIKPTEKRTNSKIANFRKSILERKKEETPRDLFVRAHLENLTIEQVDAIMKKLTIVDQLDYESVFLRVKDLLNKRRIVPSVHDQIIPKLLDIIKKNRVSKSNIAYDINDIINSFSLSLPKLIENYLPIGDEEKLIDALYSDRLLLLTGTTQCGKTQRAYYIISKLLTEHPSINYCIANDIPSAEQFLFSNSNEGRICYLEDPLGQYASDVNSILCKKLENLVRNIPINKGRYLICTSTTEIVKMLNKSNYLSGYRWHDLTVNNHQFLLNLWEELIKDQPTLSLVTSKLIKQTIMTSQGDDMIQPGQLSYLSRNHMLNNFRTIEEVKHIANVRTEDITKIILDRAEWIQAMLIMGIGASTQTTLNKRELFYLNNSAADYLPGINNVDILTTGLSILDYRKEKSYSLPSYTEITFTDKTYEESLSALIDRGFIRCSKNAYSFSHPIYQESARNLISGANPSRFDRAIQIAKKLIGCLDYGVALHTAKNLYLIWSEALDDSQLIQVVQLAEIGTKSTFVAVRDYSVLFLVSHYDSLNDVQKDNLIKNFDCHITFDDTPFFWDNGIAFIPDKEHVDISFDDLSTDDIETGLARWDNYLMEKDTLNTYESYELLNILIEATKGKKKRIAYNIPALKYFLNFDEVFIRERAAFLLSASITDDTIDELMSLYFEYDPYVKFQLIKGLFRSWPYIEDNHNQEKLLGFMIEAFNEPFVVLNSVALFTQFSSGHSAAAFDWMYDIEDSAQEKMWYLWGELIVVLFRHLPADRRINVGRFDAALEEAQITMMAKEKVMISFVNWLLDKSDKDNTRLHDTLLYFISDNFKNIDIEQRHLIISKLLSFPGSIFQAKCIEVFIRNWNSLSDQEKSDILLALPKCNDLVKIIVLTTRYATMQIQQAAMGYDIQNLGIEDIIKTLSEEVILKSLAILYINYETKFIDNRDKNVWDALLKHYILRTKDKAFKIAIRIFLEDVLLERNSRNGLWNNPKDIFNSIMSLNDSSALMIIFDILLEYIVQHSNLKKVNFYMDLLYNNASDDLKTIFIERISANLEAISYEENIDAIKIFLSEKFIEDRLISDKTILTLTSPKCPSALKDEVFSSIEVIVMMLIENKKLRLYRTIDNLYDWSKRNTNLFNEGALKSIEEYRSAFFKVAHDQADKIESENVKMYEEYMLT